MIMLMTALGPGYVVWDKAAAIRFRRPGRATLFATFLVTDEVIDAVREDLEAVEKLDRHFTVELKDTAGEVHAIIEKTVNVRKRTSHQKPREAP